MAKTIKDRYDDNPAAGDDETKNWLFPSDDNSTNPATLDKTQVSNAVATVGAVKDINERVSAIETGTPVDPPNPVFIMTLGTETLVANIANVDGTYDSWQLVEGDDTEPVAGDGSWTTGTTVPSSYTIDSSWTASTLQPKTFWLWTLSGSVVTGYPSQTVTATTTRTVPQTPNDVTFNDITNIQANSFIVSNTVGISGLLAPTAITISGGFYSKNGSDTYTSVAGVIENGDTIRLRQTSSASDSTLTTCTVQLGLREEVWNITTAASGDVGGVISIVSATYAADEDAGPITVTLRNTGKAGAIAVGCRVSTLYDPNYHTAVEGTNYVGINGEVVEWASGVTADQTVEINLVDVSSSYTLVGELVIDWGSEYGGATIDTDNDATLFTVNGTGGGEAWEQAVGGDEIACIKVMDANDDGRLINEPWSGYEWTRQVGLNGGSLQVSAGLATTTSPTYSTASPKLTIPIEFVATGTHYVWLECTAVDNGSNSCWMGLDGGITGVMFETTNVSGLYVWSNNSSLPTVSVPSVGVHDMNIWAREERFTLTRVLLTTNPSYTPVGFVADSVWGTGTVTDHPDNPLVPQGPPPIVEDKTPDPFPFGDLVDQVLSATNLESTEIVITGINVACPISITSDPSGTAEYAIDSGSWVTAAGIITDGQTVTCRLDASSSNSTTVTMDLTIGTVTHSFSVTTVPSGAVGLTPVTSTITVSANGTTIQDKDIKIAAGGGAGISINAGVTGTIITNCRISSVDTHAIVGKGIGTLAVSYCEISNCWGSGVYADVYTSFTGEYNTIENVHTGFDLWAGRSGNTIVRHNWIKNMWKRYVGTGTPVASENANAIACRYCYGQNNLIDDNIIINEPGQCHVEDKISCYICSGTSTSLFTISNNKLKGKSDSRSDAVILVGDEGGSYFLVEDNVSLDAGQSGMAFSQGHDFTFRRNKVLCRPLYQFTDPTIGTSNLNVAPGYAAFTQGNPAPYNVVYEDNDITFWKAQNYNNTGNPEEFLNPYWFVDSSFFGSNDIGGWNTNRMDLPSTQPASLTEADVWDSAWDIRPVRIT